MTSLVCYVNLSPGASITVLAFRRLEQANMAAEGDVDLDLEAEENCTGKPTEKPRKHDSGAADLERVTDYAEEKEISSSNLETVS